MLRFRLDARTLRTRVARRIFALFLVSALLPVVVFAVYAYQEVRSQLEQDAYGSLGRDAKTAGMSILERLMMLEGALSSLAALRGGADAELPGILELRRVALEEAGLAPGESGRLAAGLPVLRSAPGLPATLELLTSAGTEIPSLLVARIDPRFLFVPERIRSDERYWVEDGEGRQLFAVPDDPATRAVQRAASGRGPRDAFEADPETGREIATVWPVFLSGRSSLGDWQVGMSRSATAVMRPLADFEASFPFFALATAVLAVAVSLRQIRRNLVPLDALADFAARMGKGDLSARAEVRSRDEFEDLAAAFNDMATQIREHVDALQRLNTIGQALSRERDVDAFLDLVLEGGVALTGASGCALVLGDEELGFDVRRILAGGRSRGVEGGLPGLLEGLASQAAIEARTLAAECEDADAETRGEWERLQEAVGIPVRRLLAVPLMAEEQTSLGALLLLWADETSRFQESLDLAESLASQAAAALRQARHVETLRGLFEGLIDLTVRAIDEKSTYTGEHCRKVPILTEMIAETACLAERGPLKDFELSSDQRYELRIAALLHDCGKVVTPVHVMDKATKLETLFDRIELVRTRFELVRRDLRLAFQQVLLDPEAGDDARLRADRELEAGLRRLDDDLAFVEWANRGRESMSARDQSYIGEIARRHSWVQRDGRGLPLLLDDEVRNLSVCRGTLNDDERKVMEDHVVSTINLLEELPFPRELRNVPYIAGAHHEHVDGTGYPQGLSGERLTMQARILGLADVFEALTAKTRPYKPGMTLSQTLDILREMRDAGQIDPHLHDLFVSEKLYLRYAAEHLDPQQIDSAHWSDLEELTGAWNRASGVPSQESES